MSWCIVYFRWLKVILIYCIVLYQNILWHTTLSGIIDKKEIYEIKAISKESSFEQTDKKILLINFLLLLLSVTHIKLSLKKIV